MLIEYRIKFEDGGVVISQRVEPGQSGVVALSTNGNRNQIERVEAQKRSNALGEFFEKRQPPNEETPQMNAKNADAKGGSDPEKTEPPGGGGPGVWPVIVFGPTVITRSELSEKGGGDPEKTEPPGGGEPEKTEPPGGGGPKKASRPQARKKR